MDHVYNPPKNARMTFKQNMRLGDDDCLQWPQPWVPDCPHYACIPRNLPAATDGSQNYILFYNMQETDFEPLVAGPVLGLGHLRPKLMDALMSFIHEAIQPHFASWSLSSEPHKTPIFANLYALICRGVVHLEKLPLKRLQVLFLFSEFQRYLLEYVALKAYMEIYKPRMDGTECRATQVDNIIGAFVQSPEHAAAFVRAGLPVWLIRPVEFAGTVRVDMLVEPIMAQGQLCLDDAYDRFPVFFAGAANDINKYRTFAEYSRSYLTYSNPFAS